MTATFLSAGLIALVLPWGFILTWIGRILVWGFLGPQMKLVDLFLRANEKKDGTLKSLMRNFDIQSNHARLSREEGLKVKDIKQVAFGTYSVQVPSFNLCELYFTIPSDGKISSVFAHIFLCTFWKFFTAQRGITIDPCLSRRRECAGKLHHHPILIECTGAYR